MVDSDLSLSRRKEVLYPVLNMPSLVNKMKKTLRDFEEKDIVNRIWHFDHTVWKPQPEEVSDRLGWLNIIDFMQDKVSELQEFAEEIKNSNFHHVVLLGMGGSSLGPEVLNRIFGSAPGFPKFITLDSTHPGAILALDRIIEPRHTLFLVSSKSGTTMETMSLYEYYFSRVVAETGEAQVGANFIAITDQDTPLHRLAEKKQFRRVFINPSNIGGRYSVLSYVGMVPAALIGIDIRNLLKTASKMQESCAPCVDIFENPGAWLGTLLGLAALRRHDKLTFVFSPTINSFGHWIEQLLAESTGKERKGIIPIINEPRGKMEWYSWDRIFVYLRLKGDDNRSTDSFIEKVEVSGFPVIQFEIGDQIDLGAEFFRWEMATAISGIILGINPFDQPDVESTKKAAREALSILSSRGKLPAVKSRDICSLFARCKAGDYLALMLFLKPSPALEKAISQLRRRILEKYHIATISGYGPAYLHSTGQLHKGGPPSGLFLQITGGIRKDIPVPGQNTTFGALTEAEAIGDFQALKARRRRIVRIITGSNPMKDIRGLAREIENY